MGYVTTQFHNLKARFVFDIRSLTISIWKSPRQWLKINFYNWLHWQIGAVEIVWHRLPSRRPTQRALDGACTSCKLELTSNCPIRTGNGCDLYQPRQ